MKFANLINNFLKIKKEIIFSQLKYKLDNVIDSKQRLYVNY